jgi:hypothetical protein
MQVRLAAGIMPSLFVASMRRAVYLDQQARPNAGKIGDVRTDGMLPSESHSADAVACKQEREYTI